MATEKPELIFHLDEGWPMNRYENAVANQRGFS